MWLAKIFTPLQKDLLSTKVCRTVISLAVKSLASKDCRKFGRTSWWICNSIQCPMFLNANPWMCISSQVTGIQRKWEREWKKGMGKLAKIVVLYWILFQWSSQNFKYLIVFLSYNKHRPNGIMQQQYIYCMMPFAICYNYTILLAYLTLTAQVC